ncbi:hypothetical protein 1 [Beihai sesarmid crab virus 1]|uniref:hypothetical protein 1 n=1 Tax=Beihai sesarmid crab virus 1 TaxID=1922661 RepID=UPI00090BA14B|nr:hypothetical protein 1 [Beihai sesarmid crab virus 1]APG78028.1 hypothetical protein 1 [Beihai sesarmid crab virus 1]
MSNIGSKRNGGHSSECEMGLGEHTPPKTSVSEALTEGSSFTLTRERKGTLHHTHCVVCENIDDDVLTYEPKDDGFTKVCTKSKKRPRPGKDQDRPSWAPSDEEIAELEKQFIDLAFKQERFDDGKRRHFKESRKRKWKTKKKKKFKPREAEPHSGSDSGTAIEEMLERIQEMTIPEGLATDDETAKWFSHFENLVLLAHLVYKAPDMSAIFSAVCCYIKMNTKRSILLDIMKLVDGLVQAPEAKIDEVEPHAWTGRDVLDSWKLLKSNPIFQKLSFLISAGMTLVACEMTEISWSPMGFKLIHIEAMDKQIDAVTFFDALLETFVWSCETGVRVMEQKSLKPILYTDQKMQDFNESCDFVIAHADQALAGNMDIGDFEKNVDDVLQRISELKAVQPNGPTAVWLQHRYASVVTIKQRIVMRRRNTEMRFAPIGWALTGATGIGKSTLGKLTMSTSLNSMGFSKDSSRIITDDEYDDYDSTMTSDITGIYFDDVGNGKPQFESSSPTNKIIKYFNNVAAQAVKAELNQKGVVFIDFKCGVVTSNQKDLHARHYSDCPESILRRFFFVRMEVKPEYRKKGTILLDTGHPTLLENPKLTQDVWNITIEECIPYMSKNGKTSYTFGVYSYVDDSGRKVQCIDMGLKDYLKAVVHTSKQHERRQRTLLSSNKRFDAMVFCKRCFMPDDLCDCPHIDGEIGVSSHKAEPHSLVESVAGSLVEVVVDSTKKATLSYFKSWISPVEWANSLMGFKPIKMYATNQLATELAQGMDETFTPFLIACTPDWVFNTRMFQRSIDFWRGSAASRELTHWMTANTVMMGATAAVGVRSKTTKGKAFCLLGLACNGVTYYMLYAQRLARMQAMKEDYEQRRDALPAHLKSLRDNKLVQATVGVVSLVVGCKLLRLWASAVEPNSGESDFINKVDNSPGWFGYMMEKVGISTGNSPNSAPTHLVSTLLKSNLYWGRFENENTINCCNVFFPRKSVMMFPTHLFYPGSNMEMTPYDEIIVHVIRHEKSGGTFDVRVSRDQSIHHDVLDLTMAFAPNCPDLRDKSKFFSDELPHGVHIVNFIGRNDDGVFQEKVTAKSGVFGHRYRPNMPGSVYTTRHAKKGACMSILTSIGNNPCFHGFHIAGIGNEGRSMSVTRSIYEDMLDRLEQLPGVILSAQATRPPSQQYGRDIMDTNLVHPNSMVAKLEQKDYVDALGSTKLRTQQKSVVEPSILSSHVTKHCGVPNIWGPPRLKPNWRAYNETLKYIVDPADMFPPSELVRARKDYLDPLLDAMKVYVKTEDFRVLTDKEAILGIHGKRFIEPLQMNTSMGFPIFGAKKKYFDEIRSDTGVLIDRIPHDCVKNEIARLVECWKAGERGYPVVSATLKDEPTKISSPKVRVFQAGGVAMTILMRKYFLPIARFLCIHPLLAEMAVGVNAFSQEWETLMKHAREFAPDDQMLAWDYSKYDVRMNSQITRAVYSMFIDLARVGGYHPDDIRLMEMMIVDIVHPLIDYNGTMIMAYNMNTSGNPLTVILNSGAGSLYVRLGFFHVYPEVREFRSAVKALTYGDDFVGSVKQQFRNFNNCSYAEYLAKHNMKITSPDKKTEISPFLDRSVVDFLKRQSNYIPEIGCEIGRLDEMSIFKALHQNLRSKTETKEQVAISCVETAMHEWFAHGREVYELRQTQMKKVCEAVDLPIPAVMLSYDERAAHWKEKYSSSCSDDE